MVSIASGSSGNCIYIGSDNTHVLVDAGISNKRIEMGLNDLGLNARMKRAAQLQVELEIDMKMGNSWFETK